MNWKLTAALVVACTGLGAYAYFVEAKKDAPLPNDSQEARLWNLKADTSVNRVRFDDGAGHRAEYLKPNEKDGWRFAPRASDSLETFNWETPYNNLASLVADRKVESSGDAKEFGFDKPSLTVALGNASQPERYTLRVGGKNALDASTYYAQVNQDKAVYILPAWKVEGWQKLAVSPPVASLSPSPAPAAANSTKP